MCIRDRCEQIFGQLKEFLSSPAVIKKPRLDLPIVVYLAVSEEAVSAALVQEVDHEEHPAYFVSRTLHAAETRYHRESGTSPGADSEENAPILPEPRNQGKDQLSYIQNFI